MDGGLGNQMFQYALYLHFSSRQLTTKADISQFEDYKLHNGYELERIFNIKASYAGKRERAIVNALSKCMHLLSNHPYREKARRQWQFQESFTRVKFGLLRGYWQTEKYFEAIAPIIREQFSFPVLQDEVNKQLLSKIQSRPSVSLHIRRGDYLNSSQSSGLPLAYYKEAISFINASVPGAYYVVFSDDIAWAREYIQEKNVCFVDWNSGSESYRDMQLMSHCQHNIIANSSFSWWGAWLNAHEHKIVIAPQQWMPGIAASTDIIPKGWIQVPVSYEPATNLKNQP